MQSTAVRAWEQNINSTAYSQESLLSLEKEKVEFDPFVITEWEYSNAVSIQEFYKMEEALETSITFQDEALIRKLKQFYILDNPNEIKNFLSTNYYLIEILFEAPYPIYRIFGKVSIHLELHHDPEEAWDELFIVIRSNYSSQKAIKLENRIVEKWFIRRMKDTKGKLNIVEEPL